MKPSRLVETRARKAFEVHEKNTSIGDQSIDRAELPDREFRNFLRRLKLTYIAVDQCEVVGSCKFLRFRRVP
jgi:hypothetical protein